MPSLIRARLVLGLAILAVACLTITPSPSQAQKKKLVTKSVPIRTFDGVTLSATLYPNQGGKRNATVVFLHHFDAKKGGSSADAGWSDLAAALVEDGYTVLSFDFRGFGESKDVSAEKFWAMRHNGPNNIKKKAKQTEQIKHDQFKASYYPYLVNDLAAVKAYLDTYGRNDKDELNLILIGAGDGATVGALWLAHASRLYRDKVAGKVIGLTGKKTAPEEPDDPEIKDVAGALWLSMSGKMGSPTVRERSVRDWCVEAGKQHKVPMAWVYGKGDAASDKLAATLVSAVKGPGGKAKDLEHTGKQPINNVKLSGAALLDKDLGTIKGIQGWLAKVLEDRKSIRRRGEPAKTTFWYRLKTVKGGKHLYKLNKDEGPDVGPVELELFGIKP